MSKSDEIPDLHTTEWVNGVDHAWLRMDSTTNLMVINALVVTDILELGDLLALLKKRLLSYPRFSQRPVEHMGVHYWEDDALFNLEEHVEEIRLSESTKDTLQACIGKIVSAPLDSGKPLWQVKLIQGYDESSAVFLRVHHSYADGVSLIKVFDHLTDSTCTERPESRHLPRGHQKAFSGVYPMPFYQRMVDFAWHTAEKTFKAGVKASEEGLHILRDPSILGHYAKETVRVIGELSKLSLMPADDLPPLKPTLGVEKCCAWSEPVPLEQVKLISRVLGGTVNDVLLAVMTGALRDYLIKMGENVDRKVIHVAVPVNLRPGENGHESKMLGNQFGMIFVPMPVGMNSPLERLYQIKHDTVTLKSSPQPVMSFGMLYAAGMLPEAIQKNMLNLYGNKVSAVLSNVPGTKEQRYFAGKPVRQQMFWVPQTGDVGLGLSMVSYNGHVQFGVVSDKNLCDQPQLIMDACLESLQEYADLANRIHPVVKAPL